ncbi:hypothetical protein GCM10025864_30510 [Luteimicrobium album]|uniref:Uncharacterized protein n=1 Tax=Luteimicrobium album TaxID=1054550 RepID=A0ABQ6I502_9MICO|nr:hypothetical protein [Luteimicrobium album]GMA25292.1 hypothetical protein GCM10025864_30510 [Luteimicrobium album]
MAATHLHPFHRSPARGGAGRSRRRGTGARDLLDGVVAAAMAVLALVALVLALVLVGSWVGRAVAGHGLTSVSSSGVAPAGVVDRPVSDPHGMMGA